MGCDSEKGLEKRENSNHCAVFQQSPSLNIHSENSFVKIGDEFNFSKNVLIVVPDEPRGETRKSVTKTENKPRRDSSKNKLTDGESNKFSWPTQIHLCGDWLRRCRYKPSATHKALYALIFAVAVGLILVIALNSHSADRDIEIPEYVNCSMWESQPRKCPYSRLGKPASLVIVQHTTGIYCCNFSECQQSVKNSQNWHLSLPYYCDVRFAFLVGGDCKIYEGRNFSEREKIANDPFYNLTVEVAFIGNYSRDQPSDCQINHFLQFLNDSVSAGYLDKDFKVVGALQAYSYEHESPGKYLMDKIKHWSMWTNKTLRP